MAAHTSMCESSCMAKGTGHRIGRGVYFCFPYAAEAAGLPLMCEDPRFGVQSKVEKY